MSEPWPAYEPRRGSPGADLDAERIDMAAEMILEAIERERKWDHARFASNVVSAMYRMESKYNRELRGFTEGILPHYYSQNNLLKEQP